MFLKTLRYVFVLFILAVLPGCLVQTETFLTERADAETDDRLIGVWTVPHNEDETGFLFVREADDGGMDVLTLELREDDDTRHQRPKWDVAVAWPTTIAGLGYLNLIMDDGRLIVAYRVNADDTMEFGVMNTDLLKKAVQAGKLKGKLEQGFLGTEVLLTDSADNIKSFIRDNGGHDLFVFGDPKNENDVRLILKRHRLTQ